MPIFKYENGDQVKDIVTGFKGVIIARSEWMNRCVRYAVRPREMYEGKPIEDRWFDEDQIVPQKGTKNLAPQTSPSGGPKPAPRQFGH